MACNNEKPCGNQCGNPCGDQCGQRTNSCGYLIILVLYILLAILLGSCIYY
ncbi:MAG: hypothetical protein ACLU8V_00620 [Oscillospiraceae bacterium]